MLLVKIRKGHQRSSPSPPEGAPPLRERARVKDFQTNSLTTFRLQEDPARKAPRARTKSRSYGLGSYSRCQQVPPTVSPSISSPPRQAAPSSNKPLVIRRGRKDGEARELFNASYQSNIYDKAVSACHLFCTGVLQRKSTGSGIHSQA